MKKILATILALVMALALCTTSWADDAKPITAEMKELDTGSYKLTNNVTLTDGALTVKSGATVTLDLGTFTLTNKAGEHTIVNNGTLTITGSGTVDNVSHARAALYNAPGAVATLNGGTFDRSHEAGKNADDNGNNSYYTIKNFGEMVVNSGVTVQQDGTNNNGTKGKFSSLFANGWQNVSTAGQGSEPAHTEDAVLTINGGTFIGGLNTVKNDDCGVMTINGGEFKNFAQACVQNHNKLTITNGNFDGSELKAIADSTVSVIYNCGCGADNDKGMLSISGGTFSGGKEGTYVICDVSTVSEAYTDISGGTFTTGSATMIGKTASAKVAISGGTFSSDVDAYVAADKIVQKDGNTYKVVADGAITSGTYTSQPTVPSGYKATKNDDGTWTVSKISYYYYPSTSDTTTSTTTKGSPKTFDAGIALYVGMALTSVTGLAYTGKKKF